MIQDLLIAFLWSISPIGEAKVRIPYGIFHGADIYLVFIVCFVANILVFPMMQWFLTHVNSFFWPWKVYKKSAIYVARKAKAGSGKTIGKYGFLGLVFFVMLPVPGTGVYAGSIASYLFKMDPRKACVANTIGIFFSSLMVWGTTVLTMKGVV